MNMRSFNLAAILVAGCFVATAATAQAPRRHHADQQASATERLNAEALRRARQGVNSPAPGPDTTQNLNRISEGAARSGQNMNQAPMPFR